MDFSDLMTEQDTTLKVSTACGECREPCTQDIEHPCRYLLFEECYYPLMSRYFVAALN
jgi:hypothetical protein